MIFPQEILLEENLELLDKVSSRDGPASREMDEVSLNSNRIIMSFKFSSWDLLWCLTCKSSTRNKDPNLTRHSTTIVGSLTPLESTFHSIFFLKTITVIVWQLSLFQALKRNTNFVAVTSFKKLLGQNYFKIPNLTVLQA